MTDRQFQITLSVALILAVVAVAVQVSSVAGELTRIRATTEQSVYGAVQKDPHY